MPNRNRLLSYMLFAAILLAPLHGRAQQNPPADGNGSASQQEQVQKPPPASQQPSPPPDEQFVPSESISEDLSVPFPVDI